MLRLTRVVFTGTRKPLLVGDVTHVLVAVADACWAGAEIAVGDCPTGVDAVVRMYLERTEYPHWLEFRADWDRHGKAAGPRRNLGMVRWASIAEIKLCFGFPDPDSKGTLNCLDLARDAGLLTKTHWVGGK